MKRIVLTLMLGSALAGCSMDPRLETPAAPVPASWPAGDAYLKANEAALPSVTYQDIFKDPRLQKLIEQALANNRDLRIAAANIAARARSSASSAPTGCPASMRVPAPAFRTAAVPAQPLRPPAVPAPASPANSASRHSSSTCSAASPRSPAPSRTTGSRPKPQPAPPAWR